MKTMLHFTAAGLLVLLAVPVTHAQTTKMLRANIPFDFAAGSKTIESGSCEIDISYPPVALVRCHGGQDASYVLTNFVSTLTAPAASKLVFHRYGDRYFLSQVWIAGDPAGRELFRSAKERRLVQTATARTTVVLIAKR